MTELSDCIEKLASVDEADRIYAAEDIGYANYAAGVRPLLARLPKEPSRAVREAIFAALLQIDDDTVIEGALDLLASEDSFLRNQAVELLRASGSKTLPYLHQAFRHGDRDRRKFVVDVLARLADPASFELYAQALNDSDLNVVITAVESLGNRGQTHFRAEIEKLVSRDAHPMLLGACIEALAEIGDSGSLRAVRQCFETPEGLPAYLRPSYLKLMGAKGDPVQIDEIACFIGVSSLDAAVLNALTALRNRFPEANVPASLAPSLRDMASRNQPAVAYKAVRLLSGLTGDKEVIEFLTRCLDHPEKVIRIGAIQAMREAGDESLESILANRLARETDAEVLQAGRGKSAE